jgi:hypothetical protein
MSRGEWLAPNFIDLVAARRLPPDNLPGALDDVREVDAFPLWLTRNMAAPWLTPVGDGAEADQTRAGVWRQLAPPLIGNLSARTLAGPIAGVDCLSRPVGS